MSRITKVMLSLLALPFVGFLLFPPATAHATYANDACQILHDSDPSVTCNPAGAAPEDITNNSSVRGLIESVVNVISIVVGIVAVIMIIIGGFRYVVSGGDSNNTKAAKDTILYAVIGLVIVLFAQVIVKFVLTQTVQPATPTDESAVIVAPLS